MLRPLAAWFLKVDEDAHAPALAELLLRAFFLLLAWKALALLGRITALTLPAAMWGIVALVAVYISLRGAESCLNFFSLKDACAAGNEGCT